MNEREGIVVRYMEKRHLLEDEAKTGSFDLGRFSTIAMFALFVAALLIAIVMGTRTYQYLDNTRSNSQGQRLALGLVSNAIRSCDATGAVSTGTGPEGPALILTENLESGSYETRIYLYQGALVQEYALTGAASTPEIAEKIVDTNTFSFTYRNGLITITTDQGTAVVNLRSTQGGV